jgi:Leucine-rich repeat (LRR) protein
VGKSSGNDKQELIETLKQAKEEGRTELTASVDAETLPLVYEIASLKDLTLYTGDQKTLPPGLGRLTELTSLNINGAKLEALPSEIGELKKLDYLEVKSEVLSEVPEEIGSLSSLRDLTFRCALTGLPRSIGKLVHLEKLDLYRNKLSSVPEELGMLANLQELDLGYNELESLPTGLAGLTSLKELTLVENRFKGFPDAVLDVASLEVLDLQGTADYVEKPKNDITEIPDGITRLGKLRELNMPNNKVRTLSKSLFATHIAVLNLESNQIKEVPKEIVAMSSLVELNLEENPIANVPEAVIARGKDAIFEHLGLVEVQTVSGDLPADPKELKAVLKRYQDRMEEFAHEGGGKRTDEIMAFLSGKTNKVPFADVKLQSSLAGICRIFAPYAEWSFVDRRLLHYITQSAWSIVKPGLTQPSGYYEGFMEWLSKQIVVETDEDLFGKVAAEVITYGIAPDLFLRLALTQLNRKLVRDDKTPTSFGRYLLAAVKGDGFATMVEAASRYYDVRVGVTALLSANDAETFARVAPEWLKIEPNKKGEIHTPWEQLKPLCARDPQSYEGILLEAIAKTNCLPCKAEAVRVLAESYSQKHGEQAFGLACEVLQTISKKRNTEERYEFYWSDGPQWRDGTAEYIAWMLACFGVRAKDAVFAFADNTKAFDLKVAAVVAKGLGQAGIEIIAEGLKMDIRDDSLAPHYRQLFALLAPLDYSKYYDKVWEIAQSEFRKISETACLALARLDAKIVLPKAKELLSAKKANQRQSGALILTLLKVSEAKEILKGLLDSEGSDDVRDLAVDKLFEDPKQISVAEAILRVASAKKRGKLDKPAVKWLDDANLPPLKWSDGKKLDLDTVRFLFYRQSRADGIFADPEARDVYPLIDRKSSGDFAVNLLDLAFKNGGISAKTRFAIAPVGMLGDERVIAPIEKVAVVGTNPGACAALGLLGSFEAARALDRIRKVFRIKYPNVRQAAQEAFTAIADKLGKTPFELSDLMVPDFSLKNGRRPFPVGADKLELVLTADRSFELVDAKGKSLKSLPKAATAQQKDELKNLRQSLAEAARQLGSNLEYYLIVQRRWSAADWQAFFTGNPLAAAFASGLVWGIYQANALKSSFRIQPDGSFAGYDGKSVTLGKDAAVGIVHPLELSPADRAAWHTALASVEQPFPQIDRPVFAVSDQDREKTFSFAFEDQRLNALSFKSRAERRGWRRGSVVDSGEVSAYRKSWPYHNLESFLRLDGMNVRAEYDSETTLEDFFFVKAGSIVVGSYTYDEPRNSDDPRLLKMSDVPLIVYSETVADLYAITKKKAAEGEDEED